MQQREPFKKPTASPEWQMPLCVIWMRMSSGPTAHAGMDGWKELRTCRSGTVEGAMNMQVRHSTHASGAHPVHLQITHRGGAQSGRGSARRRRREQQSPGSRRSPPPAVNEGEASSKARLDSERQQRAAKRRQLRDPATQVKHSQEHESKQQAAGCRSACAAACMPAGTWAAAGVR